MKIGLVLAITPGYTETFFTSKIRGLQAQGHQVVVFASKRTEDFTLCSVKQAPKVYSNRLIQFVAMLWQFFTLIPYFGNVRNFIKLEQKEETSTATILKRIYLNTRILKSDLHWLHFGFATQAIGREVLGKAIGAKVGVSFRGFDINVYPLKHPSCYDKLWNYVDKVHSISEYLLEKAYTLGLSENTPATIITPAVDMTQLPVPKESHSSDQIQIVTIARLTWIKGIDVAIDAMRILHQIGVNFTYHIIGDGTQKMVERYQFMTYEYGLQDRVVFRGKLSHQATLQQLQQATIYVQPSYNEGFCNAVLEAQAMGKLVIASDGGALPENVLHKTTGWLFPAGQPEALADRIVALLKITDEEKNRVSQAAKSRVAQHFTVQKQQQEFVQFFRD